MERVQPVPGMSWKKVDIIVTKFISLFYPELLKNPAAFPVQDFLEFRLNELGYDWEIAELQGKEAETDFSEKIIRISPSTYNALCKNDGRARFTVMHEIGHVLLHNKYFRGIIRKENPNIKLQRSRIPSFRDPECQANVFAGAALMPTKIVKEMIKNGTDEYELSDLFGVSYSAACNRIDGISKF